MAETWSRCGAVGLTSCGATEPLAFNWTAGGEQESVSGRSQLPAATALPFMKPQLIMLNARRRIRF